MNPEAEPRHEGDYTDRQVVAARRALVDVAQVLAAFRDAMVVVGGTWQPAVSPTTATRSSGKATSDWG